ncbi:MAG TPA: hypothetical protein DGG95_14050, partial [Cytophagales bacterium]|nr:hypothetical protein [Cytophagales bacterium]
MNKYEILKGEDLFRPYYNNSTGQKVNLFWTTSQRFEKEFNDCEYDGLGRLKYLRLKQFSIVEILKETLFENTPFSIPGVSYKGAVGIEYLRKHSSIFQNVTIDAAAPNFIRSYALKLMLFLLQDYNYITEIALPKYRPIKLNELIINLESNASQQNEVDHLLFQFLILKGVLKQSNLLEEIINKRIKDSILTSWQTAKVELEYAPLTVSNEREELASLTRGQIEIKIKESLQDELV